MLDTPPATAMVAMAIIVDLTQSFQEVGVPVPSRVEDFFVLLYV